MRLTYLLIAFASGLLLSCAQQNISRGLHNAMIHFVNGTTDEISVDAARKNGTRFSAHAIEGGWIDLPSGEVNIDKPIVVLSGSERVVSSYKFNRFPKSDTVIIVGNQDFLSRLIVYIDRKGDTTKNHIDYFFDTNQRTVVYQRTIDLDGNLVSEGLLVPDYVYRGEAAGAQSQMVPVGPWVLYQNGVFRRDTIPFKGLEKLPVIYKER